MPRADCSRLDIICQACKLWPGLPFCISFVGVKNNAYYFWLVINEAFPSLGLWTVFLKDHCDYLSVVFVCA